MKVIKLLKYNFLLIFLLLVFAANASLTEVSKTINKSYSVSADTKLEIVNKFGKIHVNTWEKNEFSIEVEIIAEASSEEKAQRLLDNIDIDISESSNVYAFETDLNNSNTRNNERFEINYVVNMPSGNPINIKNSFGDVYLSDRNGEADVNVSYGSLKAGDFNERSEIRISFGKATIGRMSKSESIIKYSDVKIEFVDELDLEQGFSDILIEEVSRLDIKSKYGDVEIGTAGVIDGDVQFSGFTIERLKTSLDLKSSYISGFEIQRLENTFVFVYLTGKFGSYEIGLAPNLNADLEAEFEFSDLKYSGVNIDFNYKVKESFKSEYRGKINGGNPNKKIIIDSSYGDCKLREF